MKVLFSILVATVFSTSAYGLEEYNFSCDINGVKVQSIAGMKAAPDHPVVGLNIKVLSHQVPLYLVQVSFDQTIKNIFVTDWVSPTLLSGEGEDLLSLLSLFYGVKTDDLVGLRAGLPTDLLESFAYLELKHADQSVTKLAFEGIDPYTCN